MRSFSIKSLALMPVAACSVFATIPAGAQTQDPAVAAYLQAVYRDPAAFGLPVAGTCYGTPVEPIVEQWFGHTPDYDRIMRVILPRESGCDPCAYYPSKHNCAGNPGNRAKGLFQLLGHDAQIRAACPLIPDAWRWAECNTIAAWWLYEANGLAPWRG